VASTPSMSVARSTTILATTNAAVILSNGVRRDQIAWHELVSR
jgi:hypothetical protein